MELSRVRQSRGVSDSAPNKHLKVLEGAGYVEATKARGLRTPIPGPRLPLTADGLWQGTSRNSAASSTLRAPLRKERGRHHRPTDRFRPAGGSAPKRFPRDPQKPCRGLIH
ncbi:hypothetical protein [Streptomyces sp. 021-4]|uniref:hypothetical protein n=1 Tax=Streptomyces sp. 021-4 TaxID=2789260 RepID=UPI0039F640F4